MEVLLISVVLAVALFVAAFITKRRFGLLGLALAAGSLLSGIWSYDAGLLASLLGFPTSPLTTAIVSSVIVLLPAAVLLFHGSTYKTLISRVVGASLFTLLATAFLIDPLSHILIPKGFGANVYAWIVENRNMVIGAGLIAAVVDLFLTKPAHMYKKHRKH